LLTPPQSEPDSADVQHLLLYPVRDSRSFLSSLPDSALLSSLSLPGTHESLAMHGWPVSQCQSAALTAQLNAGVRFLDVRLALKVEQGEERLLAFHGPTEQFRELGEVLTELYAWLDGPGKRGEHPHAPIAPSC
jgi:1-phosphatidylinositol phosphodiesterase